MAVGAYLHTSKPFESAIQTYQKYLKVDYEWQPFDKSSKYSLKNGDFFLLHNSLPENLKTIDVLKKIHGHASFCAIPIIFVSEDLCDETRPLFEESEFVWKVPLPFDSGVFHETIEKARDYTKQNLTLLVNRTKAQIAISQGKFPAALELYNGIKDKYPHPFRLGLLYAEICLGLEKFDEGIAAAQDSKSLIPSSMEADSMLARLYLANGDQMKHNEVLESMTKKAEVHLKNLIHWGNVYMEQGKTKKSQSVYEAALEKDPENIEAKQGILAANLISGQTEAAQEIIDGSPQALELARLCNMKGIAMAQKGQFRSAEKLYRNAIKFLPDQTVVHKLWLNLGLCLKKKGDNVKALEMFSKSAASAPEGYDRAEQQIDVVKQVLDDERRAREEEENRSMKDSLAINYETFG